MYVLGVYSLRVGCLEENFKKASKVTLFHVSAHKFILLFLPSPNMCCICLHLSVFVTLFIRPTVGTYLRHTSFCRRDVVIINRLRIGHTRLTHSYLLAGGHQPECVTCQCPLTVKHILVECTDFRDIRNKYFVPSTMKDVFEQVSMRNVINFIKETHFYNLL